MQHFAAHAYVAAMTKSLLRIAALAAVVGTLAQTAAALLEPDWDGPPAISARVVADTWYWNGDRLLDLIGVVLTVVALGILGCTFTHPVARGWAQAALPLLPLASALGAAAIVTGATMKDAAESFVASARGNEAATLAAYDTTSHLTET